jgi:hypothetical protein
MDQGTAGVTERSPEELRHEIDVARQELGGLLAQLDRRRKEFLDWRLLVRRHPLAAARAGALVLLGAAGVTWRVVRRNRHRERLTSKARRLRALSGAWWRRTY